MNVIVGCIGLIIEIQRNGDDNDVLTHASSTLSLDVFEVGIYNTTSCRLSLMILVTWLPIVACMSVI